MDYLYFEDNNHLTQKAKRLHTLPVQALRFWDWETLDQFDLVDMLYEIISHPYVEDSFVDEGLWNLFRQRSVVYKELVVEFLASFKYEEGPHDDNFNTRNSIAFRLCEKWHETSLIGFAKILGIVDRNQDEKIYKVFLDKATSKTPPGYNLMELWAKIGMNPYDSKACCESDLSSPLYRLTHRLLSTTILFHSQPERVIDQHLKGMWYVLHPECRWNLPHVMALMFKDAAEEKFDMLPGGQFITHMAISLNFLDQYAIYACTPVKPVKTGLDFFVQTMLLKKLHGDKYRLYKDHELLEDTKQGGASSSRAKAEI